MLRCRVCTVRFSERKGTPLFDSRLSPEKFESVMEHIAEGCGVRQTGRLCKVNRGTVGRLSRLAGEHARDLHDEDAGGGGGGGIGRSRLVDGRVVLYAGCATMLGYEAIFDVDS